MSKTTHRPVGSTIFGITVWADPATGRALAWGGPGDRVHLHRVNRGGSDGWASLGREVQTLSEPCDSMAGAQAAVDNYLNRQGETDA